jgi:dephospho-CoA kinase
MFLVGLTGGIAAGKSVVSATWEDLGAFVVDADVLAREVVLPGSSGLSSLVALFGSDILQYDGSLDRQKLGELVFSSDVNRKTVESILHPLIKARALAQLANVPSDRVGVYVIPLLVESKSDLPFDFVVTVEAPMEEQVKRLVENRGMTESEAIARIKSQASPAERANVADRVLSSNQSLELLKKDAKVLWNEITRMTSQKASE